MSVVTALTAQNTKGIVEIMEVTPEFLGKQLDSVFTDIYPDAVKIGMVSSAEMIEVIAERLKRYKAKNIVVDPVMISTSGLKLIQEDAIKTLKKDLFPQAMLLTPNILEASALSGINIINSEDMIKAAKALSDKYGCAVLCKGGHSVNDANDLLYWKHNYRWFAGERIDNQNTHGTGCTLSSAIASGLAKGLDLEMSIELAKEYISGALKAMLDIGLGNGPLNHAWDLISRKNINRNI
jgi:hydroxymethylpyrimidine/phosphomethylpyrimidine kinase